MTGRLQAQVVDHVWEGVYPTWQDARAAAEAIGAVGMDGDVWLRKITQQLTDYREELRVHGVARPPRPSSLPLVCALTRPSTIVDFGGSSGWCWDYLQESLSGSAVSSYVVVETDTVVDYMNGAGLQAAPVRFQTSKDALGATDLLYCNSVLQYFSSNEDFLSLVESTRPKFIVLDDLVAGAGEDFFTLQLFWGSAIPYRFIGLRHLLDELATLGYLELARCPYESPIKGLVAPFPMSNFPQDKQLRYSSSVLLTRRDSK